MSISYKNKHTIKEFARNIIERSKFGGVEPSKNTLKSYTRILRQFFEAVNKDYDEVTTDDIKRFMMYLSNKGRKPTTINCYLYELRSFYKFLKRNRLIDENPTEPVFSYKKPRIMPVYIPENKIKDYFMAVVDYSKNPYKSIFLLLPLTGLRISEMLSLKIHDIIDKNDVVFLKIIGKRGKEREVPLSKLAHKIIKSYIDKYRSKIVFPPNKQIYRDILFVLNNGNPVKYFSIWYQIKLIGKLIGIPNLHPHALRHTYATLLRLKGVDLKIIQELLGHESITITADIYAHVTEKEKKEAVDILDEII